MGFSTVIVIRLNLVSLNMSLILLFIHTSMYRYTRMLYNSYAIPSTNMLYNYIKLYMRGYDKPTIMLRSQESVHPQTNVEIFVIDDEVDIRYIYKRFAEQENYITHTTSGIKDTLVKLATCDLSKKFIFIIDFRLADCNGVELAEEICKRGVDGVYLIITGCEDLLMYEYKKRFDSQTRTNREFHKDHCCNVIDEWIVKPVEMEEFKRVIRKYV